MNARTIPTTFVAAATLLVLPALADAGSPSRAEAGKSAAEQMIELEVTSKGFQPANLQVKAGIPVRLRITRRSDRTCAKDVVVVGHVQRTELPLDQPVEITFTPKVAGTLRYGCSMNQMVGGVITVG